MSLTKTEGDSQRIGALEIVVSDETKPTPERAADQIILNKKEIKVGAVFANMAVIGIGFLQYGKALFFNVFITYLLSCFVAFCIE